MKIHCSKEDLSKGVQTIQSALSQRTTLPILLNFLMETENALVKVVSTDLEMGVKHYMNAEVEADGSVAIPAKKFSDILHSLPDGKDIELSVDPNGKVHIKCGKANFRLIGASKSEYPALPEFNKTGSFTLPTSVLGDMVKKTIFAASSDETRYVLNGVFWIAHKGELSMVATDGRRLAMVTKRGIPVDKEFKVIVPTKILGEFLRLLNSNEDEKDEILIGITENQIAFQFHQTTFLSRLIEGNFPSYETVIPTRRDIQVIAPTKELTAITRRAALAAPERGGSVRYGLHRGFLRVSSSTQNIDFEDEIETNYNGEEFTIAFNPVFLLDFLKATDANSVVLSFTTPVNPALAEPEGEPGYRYVVMPMRS